MFWNIQNLSRKKTGAPGAGMYLDPAREGQYISEYIASVVRLNQIKILAILEVLGAGGTQVAQYIKTALGDDWDYVISSVQRHNERKERCIVFWDKSDGSGIAGLKTDAADNPASHWTYGHVDDNSLNQFFETVGWRNDREKQIQCYNGLVYGGYLKDLVTAKKTNADKNRERDTAAQLKEIYIYEEATYSDDEIEEPPRKRRKPNKRRSKKKSGSRLYVNDDIVSSALPNFTFSYRIDGNKWKAMKDENEDIVLKDENGAINTTLLTDDQLKLLRTNLVQTDILTFGDTNERNPFLVNFNIKDENGDLVHLLIVPFHASNPKRALNINESTTMKFSAINNMADCVPFQKNITMLLGGDTNVNAFESVNSCRIYKFEKKELDGEYRYWPTVPDTLPNPFINITTNKINASALPMGNGQDAVSSIKDIDVALSNYNPDVLNDINYNYKSEAYDKFFFKTSTNQIVAKNTKVLDLILIMNHQKAALAGSVYNTDLAVAGVRFFKSRWSDEFAIAKVNTIGAGIYTENLSLFVPDEDLAMRNTVDAKRREINAFKRNVPKSRDAIKKKADVMLNTLNLITSFNNARYTVPENQFIAFFVYSSISDHFPIITEIGQPAPTT